MSQEGSHVLRAGARGSRWLEVAVAGAAADALAGALAGAGCLVVRTAAGLRVAQPGASPEEALAALRFFLASWQGVTGTARAAAPAAAAGAADPEALPAG